MQWNHLPEPFGSDTTVHRWFQRFVADGVFERLRRVVRAGLDGDKPAELADVLSTTVGVIFNLHYRANQLLRECLQKG